jgi:FMN phosphatase YigB (HAD superfamily)
MRISFDLDDTLIMSKVNSHKNRKRKLVTGEYLRDGAIELLKDLCKQHEVVIYTTSYRSSFVTKIAFLLKKIRIKQVINNSLHLKAVRNNNFVIVPSKFPPQFGIDVHIDDSFGVVEEGEKLGFKVIYVDPEDSSWGANILKGIQKL